MNHLYPPSSERRLPLGLILQVGQRSVASLVPSSYTLGKLCSLLKLTSLGCYFLTNKANAISPTESKRALQFPLSLAGLFLLCTVTVQAQQLELASGSASTAATGPTSASQTATFLRNTGTSTTFSSFTPATTFSVAFSNQQYTTAATPGLIVGGVAQSGNTTTFAATTIYAPFNAIGSPLATMFTSGPNSTTGTNFDIANNYGYRIESDVYYQLGQPLGGRYYYGDVTVTFSRPVLNPVLHLSGLGGGYSVTGVSSQGFYTELELSTADVSAGRSLTRLSGSTHFVLDGTSTKILNDNTAKVVGNTTNYASDQQYAGAGSIIVNSGGTAITSVTFRVYVKGDGGAGTNPVWGEVNSNQGRSNDTWMISSSLALYTIDGTVYNDANGLTDNTIISATAVNGTSIPQSSGANIPIYASLVQNGSVLQTVPVTSTGTYSFTATSGSYNVVLTTSSTGATSSTLPNGWASTGENIGTGTGTDGTADGILSVTLASVNVANANFGINQPQYGYIYLHKKALDESSSVPFTFNVTGGTTSVPTITVNDKPDVINAIDLGASHGTGGEGQLWAVTGTANVSNINGTIYMRPAGSSTWQSTGQSGYRVDGAGVNTMVYITTWIPTSGFASVPNNAYYYNGTTSVAIWSPANHAGVVLRDIAYGAGNTIVSDEVGNIWKYTGTYASGSDSWVIVRTNASDFYRHLDINPVTLKIAGQLATGPVETMTLSGNTVTGVTSYARPSGTATSNPTQTIAIDDADNVYASFEHIALAAHYVYKNSGSGWVIENQGRRTLGLTAGAGGTVWGRSDHGGSGENTIFTRTTDGSATWLDDERIRTTYPDNSVIIPVIPGTYTLTEILPSGWDINAVTTYDPTTNSSTDAANNTATVNVAAGEVVHAVFTNELVTITTISNTCGSQFLQNFGSGAAQFAGELTGKTAYHYVANVHPEAGYYTVEKDATNFNGPGNAITVDHTPDAVDGGNGYMLLVNASYSADEFYRQRINGLVVGQPYQLSFWAANIAPGQPIKPGVTFGVADINSGNFIGSVNTGVINQSYWKEYKFSFTATATTADLVLRNNGAGGTGNDIVIDDIALGIQPPVIGAVTGTVAPCSNTGATYTYTSTTPGGVWSVSPASLASINATTGVLTPVTNASGTATVTYTVTDANSCVSTSSLDIVLANNCLPSVSGNVFNDVNGLTDGIVNGTAVNGTDIDAATAGNQPVYVSLVQGSTIVATMPVQTDGSYSFTNVAAGSYTVVLSTNASGSTTSSVPTSWTNTGEYMGTGTGNDGTPDGILAVTVGASSLTAVNFGIEQVPTSGSGVSTVSNNGGTSPVTVPPTAFTSNSPSTDVTPGTVTSIRITAFPTNATSLTINGTVYTASSTEFTSGTGVVVATDGTGAPTVPILVDPTNDSNPVTISFKAIDNAGKESTNTGTATINSTLVTTTVSGQVWNDADGNLAVNGSETGTNTGGIIYVNLVDGTGTVVGSTTVSASGSYTLTTPVNVSGYKLVLTNAATSATPGPLPTGWVNTGESVGPSNTATQSTTLGQIELTTGTAVITAQNFGIEQLPSPGSGAATVTNAGGTTPVNVPATSFTSTAPSTDPAPGNVASIRITAFPTNATSLTINGVTYTASSPEFSGGTPTGVQVPTNGNGAPTVPILVDPTNDANPVVITFKAVDNAGKESTTTGTATINSTLTTTVSGTVWNDADGNLNLNGSESGTNAGGPLFVNVVNGAGSVVASTTVSPSGSYTLTNVPANTTGLTLVLTNTASSTAPGGLPAGWVNTGESVDPANTATQSTTVGQIELTTGAGAVTAQNFGIEQLPTPGTGSTTASNPGGTSPVSVPTVAFTNTTPSSDVAPGNVTGIRITAFPTNTTSLTINGVTYTASSPEFTGGTPIGVAVPTDGNGNPSVAILVDPTNDAAPVVITFRAVDNAGKQSSTTGTATLNFTLTTTVSGSVWNDADGSLSLNGSESGTNAGGPLYVNLVDGSGTVVGSTSVAANGTYSLANVPTNVSGYKLVLTNSASSNTPGSLPTNWVNTGENVDPSNTATQSTTVGQIELSTGTGAITAQNFGIEQLPSSGSGTATVSNAGGASPVSAPPSAFTNVVPSSDVTPGNVAAIRITAFPTNATSLTINGVVYTPTSPEFTGGTPTGVQVPTTSTGAPTVPILVDPTNDANPVMIPFKAVDNAGKESTAIGTATLNSTLTTIVAGQVWNDADGNLNLNGSETGTNAGGPLYVNIVDATNTVIGSTTVSPTGSYTLTGVPANTSGLKLVLASTATATTPGTLPSGWVNTGESVDPANTATQSSTLGQIELTTGTSPVTAQNFGIEQLPTPGSGTATLPNAGVTTPVTVPPSAFTNTAPSSDPTPGTVAAIHITSFPSNVTSLTINGVVYTPTSPEFSGPTPTGVLVPTDGSGSPSVAILVDPTNDASPVIIPFKAVDNAGKESTTLGTATLSFTIVPDLTPIIYVRPSTVYKTTPITVVVDVVEVLSVPSSGTLVVKLTKDAHISLTYDPSATLINGRSVQNSVWSVDSSDPSYLVLTTSQSVGAFDKLSFGFSGVLSPGMTTGVLSLSSVIVGGSGGEVRVDNNADADKVDYFQQ